MRVLICGDLHTKYNIFDQVKQLSENYDKVVFLGDYVDEWDTPPEASHNLLIGLKEFYEQQPSKVVLLLGNHELSEWQGHNFKCSGWNSITSNYVNDFMFKFHSIFKLAYAEDDILYTHAGITAQWANKYLFTNPHIDYTQYNADALARELNHSLYHKNDNDIDDNIFNGLSEVGYSRGGFGVPSPIWADINDLLSDRLIGVTQVVGHTPLHTSMHYKSLLTDLYFCDTHSLTPNKENIGDDSLLQAMDGKISKIGLDGKELPW